ncbi:hypothetical protein [Turicimonas muris]|nr:hypothetical protein [Turicimonas muris]
MQKFVCDFDIKNGQIETFSEEVLEIVSFMVLTAANSKGGC